jgi:hypothetical protein
MIVNEDNDRRPKTNRSSIHISRPNQCRGQRSRRNYFVTVDPVFVVEGEKNKMLFRVQLCKDRSRNAHHIVGGSGTIAEVAHFQTHLERRHGVSHVNSSFSNLKED